MISRAAEQRSQHRSLPTRRRAERDSAEEPRIPMNRFGSLRMDESKRRMLRVEDDIVFSPASDDTWNSKNRSSVLLNPLISESSGADHILGVPAPNLINRNGLNGHIVRNHDANRTVVLRRLR